MTEHTVLDAAALERLTRLGGASLVRRLVEMYLANGPERLASVNEAAAARDADRVERAAHTLKSSAGNVGAIRLQRTAEALEAGAAAGTIDGLLVERLVREYEESANLLRRLLEEQSP